MVLDQNSLRFDTIKKHLAAYDRCDAPNIGLVTAGGTGTDETLLRDVFAAKYTYHRAHNLWTVPPTSLDYERSVADVVSALRAELQKVSQGTVTLLSGQMPSLTQPSNR